jgi:hypothetical protein
MPLNPRNANAQAQYLPPSPPSGGAAAIGGYSGYDALLVLVLMVILGKRWQVVLFRRRGGGESSVGGIRVFSRNSPLPPGFTVRRLHLPSPAPRETSLGLVPPSRRAQLIA